MHKKTDAERQSELHILIQAYLMFSLHSMIKYYVRALTSSTCVLLCFSGVWRNHILFNPLHLITPPSVERNPREDKFEY